MEPDIPTSEHKSRDARNGSVMVAIVTLITSLLCVVNLQLGSQSKTDGNLIQILSKDLSIIKVASKTIANSKQCSFLGCSGLMNSVISRYQGNPVLLLFRILYQS